MPIFTGEQPIPTYYLSPENIYSLGIHGASNNIWSIYTCIVFERKKCMNNISYCVLCWLNDKGYYSQSYGNNHKMPEIDILVGNCGV